MSEEIPRLKYQEVSTDLLFKTSNNRKQDQGLQTISIKLQIMPLDNNFNHPVVVLIFTNLRNYRTKFKLQTKLQLLKKVKLKLLIQPPITSKILNYKPNSREFNNKKLSKDCSSSN
jgi:hypothetical protein